MPKNPANANEHGRRQVRFLSGEDYCDAWLYVPQSKGKFAPLPTIVMAHGLGGVKQLCLAGFAERFAAAGYACLVFDYRYFGDSTGEPRELLDIQSQLDDWRAAVTFARSLPEVDEHRVVVWGTSFGGGHAIVTASNDPKIAAAIAQCPFTNGPASILAINPWTSLKLTIMAVADNLADITGRRPVRVPLTANPGRTGLMTAADVLPGYRALLAYSKMEGMPERVPARIALQILFHRPGEHIRHVSCPLLLCVCANDSVAPAAATLKYAKQSSNTAVKLYQAEHFDIYIGEPFEKVIRDQIEFLKQHVPTAISAAKKVSVDESET